MKNIINKILIIILIIFISSLVVFSFLFKEPKYEINYEMVICLTLLVVLVLSELFDNLSIPKVISLSKNVKEIKKENEQIKDTNIRLLEQITNIKNSNNQNIFLPNSISTVSSDNIEAINNNRNDLEENIIKDNKNELSQDEQKEKFRMARKYMQNMEIFLLTKMLKQNRDNNKLNIQFDVRLSYNQITTDNIMKNESRFDALLLKENENIFYEVKTSPLIINYIYQLHYMLRTVELYKDIKGVRSKLILVLPNYDKDMNDVLLYFSKDRFKKAEDRIKDLFEPSINKGLLEIKIIDVTKKELDDYIKEKDS